jgi:putative membrane protein
MLNPVLKKNDKQARALIFTVSFVVFAAVVVLSKYKLNVDLGFNVHLFALFNAIINSTVSVLLVWALKAIKNKSYILHKNLMLAAILLSCLFLVSYIGHHLLGGETKYGGTGAWRGIYFFILTTHIALATIILPFILFTAYRSLTGEFEKHKKLAKYTWPLWLYVSVTGVLVYLFISPYYVPHI